MAVSESKDTSHLYDGKTVRSSAPSRKALAGSGGIGTEIPKEAIPEIYVPNFVESLLGGPLVPKMKFVDRPDKKMVGNLQLAVTVVCIALAFMTIVISPGNGTIWYMLTGSMLIASLVQIAFIIGAVVTGFMGIWKRDGRFMLASNLLFILTALRFASSKVDLSFDPFGLATKPLLLSSLVVIYAVLLVMYIEMANGVLRYSMLDTSMRKSAVYVMGHEKIVGKYHRALVFNPIISIVLATLVLSANTILPLLVGFFSEETATRMQESVELTSVYGVALGTLFVFIVVGALFAFDLPGFIQSKRENSAE